MKYPRFSIVYLPRKPLRYVVTPPATPRTVLYAYAVGATIAPVLMAVLLDMAGVL